MSGMRGGKSGVIGLLVAVFTALLIAGFWAGAWLAERHDRERTLAEMDARNTDLALALARHAERTFDYADQLSLQVKHKVEHGGAPVDIGRFMADCAVDRTLVLSAFVVAANGDVVSSEFAEARATNIAERPHFRAHVGADSGQPAIGRPTPMHAGGQNAIMFTRRVNRPDGRFGGIVAIAVDARSLTGFHREIGLGPGGLIALTGLDGFVRARGSDSGDAGEGRDVRAGGLFEEFSRRETGSVRTLNLVDDVVRHVAFRRLAKYPLVMSVGVAEATALAAAAGRARLLYAVAGVASLIAAAVAAALIVLARRRERDARRLAASEARYRETLDALPDAVIGVRDERIAFVNPAALRLLGAQAVAELAGRPILELVHPEERAAVSARIAQRIAGEAVPAAPVERRYLRLDGTPVDVEVSLASSPGEAAAARYLVVRDIGARKRAEAALRESMQRYRQMVAASPDPIFINRGERVVFANAAAVAMMGARDAAALVGRPPLALLVAADRAAAEERIAQMESGAQLPGLYEQRFLRDDGGVVEAEVSISSVLDEGLLSRQLVVRDIGPRKAAEAALRDSEARYRRLLEASPDAVLIFEGAHVSYANAAALRLFGASSAAQLVGHASQELVHPAGRAAARARREFVVGTGRPTGLWEQVFVRFDGSTVEVEGNTSPVPGSDNRQRMVTIRDISARKRAEAALRESEARLHMAVEAAEMTVWEWNLASGETVWGIGHERLLGALPADGRRPDFREMVHAEDRARFLAAGRATVAGGAPYDVEFRLVRSDGSVRWMHHSGRALRSRSGAVEGIAGVMQDVTRRREIENELSLSRQRSASLMEAIPAPAWLKDRAGRFVAVNRAWCERNAIAERDVVGRRNADCFPAELAALRDGEDAAVLESGCEQRAEHRLRVGEEWHWHEVVKTPIRDAGGAVAGIVGVSFDITRRKQAEADLRASEERFRRFADAVDDVFWIDEFDPLRTVYVNAAYRRVFGREPDAIYADAGAWAQTVHAEDRARVVAAFERWRDDPVDAPFHCEYRIVRPDGEVRYLRDSGTKLRDADGRLYRLQGIAADVTAQRAAERALAESQQRRDALLESIPSPAWLKDREGRYIAVNRAWGHLHRKDPQAIVGRFDRDEFPAPLAAQREAEDRQVMTARSEARRERRAFIDGEERWLEDVKSPVIDAAGNVTGIVAIAHDVTERKRSELVARELNAELARKTAALSALNRELESFAYTVSHDLRAPLRHIDGFLSLLQRRLGGRLDEEGARFFERVTAAAGRMGRLIDDLLAFSRTGRAELRSAEVPLERVVRDAIGNLAPDARERRVEWSVGALPVVRGDSALLTVAVQNLLSNALKYTRPREVARIAIDAILEADGAVTVAVRDNGVGFDMRYANKLFGVFQRLHSDSAFEGTGIGLATVARIVHRHGGRVWAEGREDGGAAFFFSLPRGSADA